MTADQKPEPVAWISTDCIGERYFVFTKPLDNDPLTPLFTTPPAREWVGLTDDDMQALYVRWELSNKNPEHLVLLTERALRERNT